MKKRGALICRNCSQPGEAGARLRMGLCPQCFGAVRCALVLIRASAKRKQDQMRAFGDEAADAFCDGIGFVLREMRPYLRK